MPYMPTNLYPRNCAIRNTDSSIDFLAKLDTNDKIKMYRLKIFDYATNTEKLNIYQYNDGTNQNRISLSEMKVTESQNKRYVLTGSSGRTLTQISKNQIQISYPYNTTTLSEKYYIKYSTMLWKSGVDKNLIAGGGPLFFNIKVTLNSDYATSGYKFTVTFDEDITGIFTSGGVGSSTTSYNLFFYSPFDFSVDLSEYGGYRSFPVNENNEFKLTITKLSSLLPTGAYYWTLKVVTEDYDIWITDGETLAGTGSQIIKIFPNRLIDETSHRIYNKNNLDYNFKITEGYYNETTTATKITTTATETTITLAKTIPTTSITDMYVTIDTTEYPVKSINGSTVVVQGKHPIVSETVFGQYINIYRKYMTLTIESGSTFLENEPFTIKSQAIETNMNYFTRISRTLAFTTSTITTLHGPVGNFLANYSGGKIDWHQFELYRDGILVDKTEKIYSNKLAYQYNLFYNDNSTSYINYVLQLTVHDSENCDIIITKNIRAYYKRTGVNEKLKASWDESKKAIKLDLSNFISSEATLYVNDQKVSSFEEAASWKDNGLYVNPSAKVEYKEKTEGKVEFSKTSSMFVELKLDENKDGNIFSFGNKTFAIRKNLNGGNDLFVFDNNSGNIYTNQSSELISSNNDKDFVNTQYYLDANLDYQLTENTVFSYSNILAKRTLYIVISQVEEKGTISIYAGEDFDSKSITFTPYSNIIDGFTLFGGVNYKLIKISENPVEVNNGTVDSEAISVWTEGTYFLTNYKNKQLNVSNSEPYPVNSIPDDILIYKKCSLLGEENQFTYVGKYPYSLKYLYDYSVADGHVYTYYIIKTYYINGEIRALKEIISQSITPDFYEIDIFGTNYGKSLEKDKNIYILDNTQKWYFELDANADEIKFNSENAVYSSGEYARVNKTKVNYMNGSATVKLGRLVNETEYIGDNRHALDKFKKFANSIGIKILRLKDGLVIPVDIQLSQKTNKSILVGNPTDITFEWYQVGDSETCGLIEYEVE